MACTVTPKVTEGQHLYFCIFYNVDAENYSVQYSLWDAGGLLAAHCLTTLALWQNSSTCMALQVYLFPCNISTNSCIIIIILCHANE